MEKFAVPVAPIGENAKPVTRSQWKRSLIEVTGRSGRNYRREAAGLLMQSYYEIGAFLHKYHIDGVECRTHVDMLLGGFTMNTCGISQLGVTALEFDAKGIYLASATRAGCLTVHEFESLYCQSNESTPRPEEDEKKHLLHTSISNSIDAVRWNPANQDEVACTSMNSNEVRIYDIGYISSEPTQILRKRPTVTIPGVSARRGLSDLAFLSDNSRVLASDTCGAISIWDRRASDLPQTGLTTNANSGLTSIQLNEDQCVYGASKSGVIYIWDLRGGRSSTTFQSHNEVHYSPITSVKLSSMLNKIGILKAQSNILPKAIESININPSCPYQLGFHLDDGWSGVLDMHNFQVTHIHCPPPAWLEDHPICRLPPRKPSWLPEHSIYAVASATRCGFHLLDFYPHTNSPCHVDHDDSKTLNGNFQRNQNTFIPSSGAVIACATHPLDGTIVAGTMEPSLLIISQKHLSCKNGDDDANKTPERLEL